MSFARELPLTGSTSDVRSGNDGNRVLGVIPARLGSIRLPQKPLTPLLGRPLIEWVWRRVEGLACLDEVVIAVDSDEVARVCAAFGAMVVRTRDDHPSGTDRIREVIDMERFASFDIAVNVQGDEPFLGEAQLRPMIDLLRSKSSAVATAGVPLESVEEWRDESVVKVLRTESGKALYFSRAPIPHWRGRFPETEDLNPELVLRHVGVYAYRRDALVRWTDLSPSGLERAEALEQLRPLQAGMEIAVADVPPSPAGVDTPEDVVRVERELRVLSRT